MTEPRAIARRHRLGLWTLGVVVVVTAVTLVALPHVIGRLLVDRMTAAGARDAAVADVDFNPVTGRLVVEGLSFDGLHGSRATVPRFAVNLDWLPLLERRVFLPRLGLSGTRLALSLDPRPAPPDPGTPPRPLEGVLAVIDALDDARWGVAGDQLDVKDLEVLIRRGEHETVLAVRHAALRHLDSRVERVPTVLEVDATVDGAPLLLRGALAERDGALVLEARVEARGLDLARLAAVAAGTTPLAAGRLDGTWSVRVARPQTARLELTGDGDLTLSRAVVTAGERRVEVASTAWAGPVTVVLEPAALPAQVTADGRLAADLTLGGAAGAGPTEISGLAWDGRLAYGQADGVPAVEHRGTLTVAGAALGPVVKGSTLEGLRVDGDGRWSLAGGEPAGTFTGSAAIATAGGGAKGVRLMAADGEWQGMLALAADGGIGHEGELAAGTVTVDAEGIKAEGTGLSWRGRLDAGPGGHGGADVTAKGRLALGALSATVGARSATLAEAHWEGTVTSGPADGDAGTRARVDGILEARRARLEDPGRGLGLVLEHLVLDGPLQPPGAADTPLLEGRVALAGLAVSRLDTGEHLVTLNDLDLGGLAVTPGGRAAWVSAGLAGLELLPETALAPGEPPAPLLRLGTLRATEVQVEDNHVHMADVALGGLEVSLVRRADGDLAGVDTLAAAAPPPQEPTGGAAAKDTAPPPTVAIGHLELAGASRVGFTDLATTPTFRTALVIDRLRLDGVDTRPDTPPARMDFAATLDKYTAVELAGTVDLVGGAPRLDVAGRVESLDLARLSTYTAKALGYNMTSGQLDADIDLALANGTLDSTNQLSINKLEVAPLDAETMAALETELSIPLEKALDMLRDGDDNISLALPVTGDIANPQFDVSDAVNQAIGAAVKEGAVSALTLALQPFGTFIAIARMAGEASSSVMLDPVGFQAGDIVWEDEAPAYAGKLAKLLADKPDIRLKLCGIATPADEAALTAAARARAAKEAAEAGKEGAPAKENGKPASPAIDPVIPEERLLDLARRRAERMKDHLIASHDADARRLFICNPRIDRESGATPRLDIAL